MTHWGNLTLLSSRQELPVPQCRFICGRLSLETLINSAVMTEPECVPFDGDPLGASRRLTVPVSWSGQERRAVDLKSMGQDGHCGPFSSYQVSSPHASVYIASGNKLWGNLILSEATAWLSSRLGSPVASHQATVSPLLWVCITSSTVLNYLSLTSCPQCEVCPATLRFHRHRW